MILQVKQRNELLTIDINEGTNSKIIIRIHRWKDLKDNGSLDVNKELQKWWNDLPDYTKKSARAHLSGKAVDAEKKINEEGFDPLYYKIDPASITTRW